MLMLFLTMFFSIVSTGMMSFLAMNTQLGPWVAPVFVVVVMVLLTPFFDERWFRRHIIVTIAGGSIGGMVGICLGLSYPSFFFLHRHIFEIWLSSPLRFVAHVASFVLVAGSLALILAYILKDYFLVQTHNKFPMSQLVYDVVYADEQKVARWYMFLGLGLSTIWNIVTMIGRFAVAVYAPQLHMIPLLISVGFVAGRVIAPPVLLGLVIRVFVLDAVHNYVPNTLTDPSFLITFCSGMLIVWFLYITYSYFKTHNFKAESKRSFLLKMSSKKWFVVWYLATMTGVFGLLTYWQIPMLAQWSILFLVLWLGKYMVDIVSRVGIIEIDNYVWFILLPMVYWTAPASISVVAAAVFCMVTLGLIVDLVFSYKLADLAGVEYRTVVKYQIVSIVCSAIAAGFFLLWYSKKWGIGSFEFMAPKAHELDLIIQFGRYDYQILLAGVVCALLVILLTSELLVVIGSMLMAPSMSCWLVVAGALAHLIKNRERLYPVWFGVYAGHMLWMVIQVLR